MRLIDADALLEELNAAWEDNVLSTLGDAVSIITNAPTIQREAIAHREQERQKQEPVAWAWKARQTNGKILNRIEFWNPISEYPEANSIDVFGVRELYTTTQRQQPLKRLSQLDVLKILNECAKSPYTNTQSSLGFANAIMDEMEKLNAPT